MIDPTVASVTTKVLSVPPMLAANKLVPVGTGSESYESSEIVDLEIRLLLEGLYARFGYDFRNYAYGSLKRRVIEARDAGGFASISQLQDRVFRDARVWERLFLKLSVNVTSFFREPSFFRTLRDQVLPKLRELGFIRIWHAGCATGEEVYSTAIVLHEEGLLDRCRIYATDMNESVLRLAKSGIFGVEQVRAGDKAYLDSGGHGRLSNYYKTHDGHCLFNRSLMNNVLFSQHNLVTDGVFQQFDLIVVRNVLIYFNQDLQDNVNQLLYESLAPGGYIGLGERENMRYTVHELDYTPELIPGHGPSGFFRKTA